MHKSTGKSKEHRSSSTEVFISHTPDYSIHPLLYTTYILYVYIYVFV